MTVMGNQLILNLIRLGNLSSLISENLQVHPASFELTLRKVLEFKDKGSIDFTNEKRKIPTCKELEFNENGYIDLKPGAYKVVFNEIVKIPFDCVAIGLPRSSLLRSGATVICGLWDPGYFGRSEALLLVFNPHGIRLYRNARIVQLVLIKVQGSTKSYKGIYQGENIS